MKTTTFIEMILGAAMSERSLERAFESIGAPRQAALQRSGPDISKESPDLGI